MDATLDSGDELTDYFDSHRGRREDRDAVLKRLQDAVANIDKATWKQDESELDFTQPDYEGGQAFLNLLVPKRVAPSDGADLRSFAKFATAIGEAIDAGILTDDEGETLLRMVSTRLLGRRIEAIWSDVFSEPKRRFSWLIAAGRQYERNPE